MRFKTSEGPGDGWESLLNEWTRITTPPKVRKLQRTLYRKAKAEPNYRFWSLYGELSRRDILQTALGMVARNGGCAGVDGVKIEDVVIEKQGEEGKTEAWLKALAEELKAQRVSAPAGAAGLYSKSGWEVAAVGHPDGPRPGWCRRRRCWC